MHVIGIPILLSLLRVVDSRLVHDRVEGQSRPGVDGVAREVIALKHLPGKIMLADVLTKAVARAIFLLLTRLIAEYSTTGIASPASHAHRRGIRWTVPIHNLFAFMSTDGPSAISASRILVSGSAAFVVPHPPHTSDPYCLELGDSELGLTRPALGARRPMLRRPDTHANV